MSNMKHSGNAVIPRHPVTVQRKDERNLKIEMSLPEPSLREQIPTGEYIYSKKP